MNKLLKKCKESMDTKESIKKSKQSKYMEKIEKMEKKESTKSIEIKEYIKKDTIKRINKNHTQTKSATEKTKKIDNRSIKQNKLLLIKKNLKGGNVIRASTDLINSMKALCRSIFSEIGDIKTIPADINNVASATPIPNNNLKVR